MRSRTVHAAHFTGLVWSDPFFFSPRICGSFLLNAICGFALRSRFRPCLLPILRSSMRSQVNIPVVHGATNSSPPPLIPNEPPKIAAPTLTTLRLPRTEGGHTLTVCSDPSRVRIAAVDGSHESKLTGLALRMLPRLSSLPLLDDNTAPARAARSPAYCLEGRNIDLNNFSLLLYGFWTVRYMYETVRFVLPENAKTLATSILRSGAAITSPFVPLNAQSDSPTELLLLRDAFWQGALAPRFITHEPSSSFPLSYMMSSTGFRHPFRTPKPMPGSDVYERWITHVNSMLTFRTVNPMDANDVLLFHRWQNVRDCPPSTDFGADICS
jgi:hypothetical protein